MGKDEDVRNRMIAMAERLLEQTLAGRISWTQADEEDEYLYSGTAGSVLVSHTVRNYDLYSMHLLNSRGTTVESLRTVRPDDPFTPPENELLERLFDAARREALGVDSLLDTLLVDIERGSSNKTSTKTTYSNDDPWATEKSSYDDEPPF
jgi:hypothetical protein